jgi:predicted nucleic acid-binding protein
MRDAPISSLLMDSEGLSMLVRRDRRLGPILQQLADRFVSRHVSTLTIVEAGAGHSEAALAHALSRTSVEDVVRADATVALGLLRAAGRLAGHRHAIDALVAALALRLPGRTAVITSDPGDWRRLVGGRVTIVAV